MLTATLPLAQIFSLLAISTSFIGFVLGLTDFIADYMKVPPPHRRLFGVLLVQTLSKIARFVYVCVLVSYLMDMTLLCVV